MGTITIDPSAARMNATAERDGIELDEPTPVVLAMNDERVKQRFHCRIGTPERRDEPDERRPSQGLRDFRGHPADLMPGDV
jgi:hypothetical protein